MTSGRINRNVSVSFWGMTRGWRVSHTRGECENRCCRYGIYRVRSVYPVEPGDTELPRLTSDTGLWRTTGAESSSLRCGCGRTTPSRIKMTKSPESGPAASVGRGAFCAFHPKGVQYLTPAIPSRTGKVRVVSHGSRASWHRFSREVDER